MRNVALYRGRKSVPLWLAAVIISSFLAGITGIPAAEAVGELVSFGSPTSSTLENADPGIELVLTDSMAPADDDVVVEISVTGGTASPSDYSLTSTTVTFEEGSPSGTRLPVPLSFVDEVNYENDETIVMALNVTSGGSNGTVPTHTATIVNDDFNPSMSIDDASIDEDAGDLVFTITRNGATDLAATAVVTVTGDTATVDEDLIAGPPTVTIPAGGDSSTTTYSVGVVADAVYEPDETFTVTLGPLGGGAIPGNTTATGTIFDDDSIPTLSIGDVTVAEADGFANFVVTRTGGTAFVTEVDIVTVAGEATPDEDYSQISDTLVIAPSPATATMAFDIPIVSDMIDEDTETFGVTLSAATNATITDATATGSITDDDTAGIVVDTDDGILVLEAAAVDTFTVVLSSEPTATVTIGTASADTQVAMTPSSLTFNPDNWDSPQTVAVAGIEDGLDEPDPHDDKIRLSVSSVDLKYHNYPLSDIPVTVADADSLLVTINGPNFGSPGYESVFTAVVNAGATGSIDYEWTVILGGNPVATGDKATFSFTPQAGGDYRVRSLVGDSQGQNPAVFIEFKVLGDTGGNVFVEDIIWLAEEGITRGCNPPANDNFCPSKTVTRGQMAAFLVRFLDLTAIDSTIGFADIDGHVFEQDILRLATAGITLGCNPPTNDNFCPNKGVTRGQMAAFLVRALGLTDGSGGDLFTDDDTSVFRFDIEKLATAGITRGCNPPANDNFCPAKTVTRAQMAAFLHRADAVGVS